MEAQDDWGYIWHTIFGQTRREVEHDAPHNATDDWGYIWHTIFGQTRSEVERDAIHALVLTSDDVERIKAIRSEPATTTPTQTPPSGTPSATASAPPQRPQEVASTSFPYVGPYFNQSMRLVKRLRTLETRSQDSSPEFIQIFKDLLSLHTSHNNYPEANTFVCKTIEYRKLKYGETHPLTIVLLEHVAIWYRQRRKFEEAARTQQRLSEAYKQKSIADQSWGTSPLEQLAYFCYDDGEYAQAEPLYYEVLRRVESSHSDASFVRLEIIRIFNKLARLYTAWGKYDKAEKIYHRLLTMHKADASHEQTPVHLAGLMDLLRKQPQYQTPEQFHERLSEIYRAVLGPEHPYTLHALYNLAETYKTQLNHEKAESAFLQLLGLQEKVLGTAHLKCIRTLDGLKTVYTRLKDQPKLESVYLRLIERRIQILGVSHADTGQNINKPMCPPA